MGDIDDIADQPLASLEAAFDAAEKRRLAGWREADRERRGHGLSPEREAELKAAYLAGEGSFAEMGRRFGVSGKTAWRVVNDYTDR